MIPKNKKYSNTHPQGKKPTGDKNIKLAKSKQRKIREKKLQKLFEDQVVMEEVMTGDMVDHTRQDAIYRRLEKKILGRNR
jgi:hypothetical protein|tara:strand:+ start:272 stop:511 length:240 start_codon:yes stop_codon:yes gene_type:complete